MGQMDNVQDSVQQAQAEIAAVTAGASPKSLEEIIDGLKGFGIEEFEEILTLKTKGREVKIKISNIPTTDEMSATLAAEEFKGYSWVKRVKVEILSRAISWIDGYDIRNLPKEKRYVTDPTDKQVKDVQVCLRNLIMGWGQELTEVLWKVLMTHSQRMEDRMKEQFPDSATMTEVEQRLFEQARKQVEETNKVIVQEAVAKLYDPELDGPLTDAGAEAKASEEAGVQG
jgi:hypothetical protein